MFEPEELMARIVDLEAQLEVSEMAPPYAEQLIACLEREIAKRDARIVELEEEVLVERDSVKGYLGRINRLRAELSAIKAQEPVAYIPVDRETGEEWPPVLKKGSGNICDYKPLYAAPVSEAKAQGVVMPERKHTDWRAAAGHETPNHGWNSCLDEVARLNATPAPGGE